jgi:hypothetical protein
MVDIGSTIYSYDTVITEKVLFSISNLIWRAAASELYSHGLLGSRNHVLVAWRQFYCRKTRHVYADGPISSSLLFHSTRHEEKSHHLFQ